MIYEVYGILHRIAKKLLKRSNSHVAFRMVSVEDKDFRNNTLIGSSDYFNEIKPGKGLKKNQVYPVENIVPVGAFPNLKDSFHSTHKCAEDQLGITTENAEDIWKGFIDNSKIPYGYRNMGLHYAGYILDDGMWCLPSWIWTNAAIVRMFCTIGEYNRAKDLCNLLIDAQQDCGGWIVRNDYDIKGAIPVLAPNDSAYIANNSCLEVYSVTGESKYLDSAIRCAEWIINTARDDGMVYVGYDTRKNQWQTKYNIVDVGFTAGLFSRLYQITKDKKYENYLKNFTEKYISLFYNADLKGFATSVDANDHQIGGMFGRGQAWALEGLIPAYEVLKDEKLKHILDDTVSSLLRYQDKKGGWAYNLSRPLMGIDCKATPIIAISLLKWSTDKKVVEAAKKALDWIMNHTSPDGQSAGGIFSYTVEGAIVHNMYTWTAFVYSSAYAIELKRKVDRLDLY